MAHNVSNVARNNDEPRRQQHDEFCDTSIVSAEMSRPVSPCYSNSYAPSQANSQFHFLEEHWSATDARPILPKAAFFMGDLRDGLPMLNMQAAFLMSAKNFSQKQVGVLFFVFGISQFLCLAPAGYYLDYTRDKIKWVNFAGISCAALTVFTVLTAAENGQNMGLMIFWKVLQGSITSLFPTGFNGVTLGIVGSTGFTKQVARNRVMTHVGTALVVASGAILAYLLYPNIGVLFIVSPIFAIFFVYQMRRIRPTDINPMAASGLIVESPTMTEYEYMDEEQEEDLWGITSDLSSDSASSAGDSSPQQLHDKPPPYAPPDVVGVHAEQSPTEQPSLATRHGGLKDLPAPDHLERVETAASADTAHSGGTWSVPSFNFGWGQKNQYPSDPTFRPDDTTMGDLKSRRPQTPLSVLVDPTLLVFLVIVFSFHAANSSVLPLVMQSLKVTDAQTSILLSGLCILIAQGPMAYFAKLCGDLSPQWGRKNISLWGLIALTARCFLLTLLSWYKGNVQTLTGLYVMKSLILSTQLLDSVGAGIFGTMYILVTSDISVGTGRFSLLLGMTTSAMCLGGTVSGYIGQALAQDYGYTHAFFCLGIMSLVPFLIYAAFMPETLPEYAKASTSKRRNKPRTPKAMLRKLEHNDMTDRTYASSTYASPKARHAAAPGMAIMELV